MPSHEKHTYRDPEGNTHVKFKGPIVWAPEVNEIFQIHEVDKDYHDSYEAFQVFNVDMLYIWLGKHHAIWRNIKEKIHGTVTSCFVMPGADRRYIEMVRSRIATEMGISPSQFYNSTPFYDKEFLKAYRYHYTVMCRYHGERCIRPSHLRLIRTATPTRYPLTHVGRHDYD